ncbi:hypothetical protein DFJ74DRAFT_678911 [Hyaloraphidium curvatum]|nr:hypothetical protein DFJ74DRAFT_678911 [Hyaloraphidium curvatum]
MSNYEITNERRWTAFEEQARDTERDSVSFRSVPLVIPPRDDSLDVLGVKSEPVAVPSRPDEAEAPAAGPPGAWPLPPSEPPELPAHRRRPSLPLGVPLPPVVIANVLPRDPSIAGDAVPETVLHPPCGAVVTLEKPAEAVLARPVVDDTQPVLDEFEKVTGIPVSVPQEGQVEREEVPKPSLVDRVKDAVGIGHKVEHPAQLGLGRGSNQVDPDEGMGRSA